MSLMQEISQLGIRLKHYRNGEQTTTCPQCSPTRTKKNDPCLSVKIDDKGFTFNCHHCGWTPDKKEKKYAMSMEMQRPAKQYIRPHFEVKGLNQEHLAYLMNDRKITPSVLGEYDITSVGKEIAFPLFKDGAVVNVKYRSTDKKFRQEANAEKVFFGMQNCAESGTLIIVEGEIDCLSLRCAGYPSVISVPEGAPAKLQDEMPKPEEDRKFAFVWNCREFLKKFDRIILATDNDEPGHVLAEELARRLGRGKCARAVFPSKDANAQHTLHGLESVIECINAAEDYPIEGLYTVRDVYDAMIDRWEGKKNLKGYSTGWASVDQLMTVAPGQMSIVTGIPSSGKSHFVDALMMNLARSHGMKFAICSFENEMDDHIHKLAHNYLECEPLKQKGVSREKMDTALMFIHEHFIFMRPGEDSPTIDWIIGKGKEATLRHGINGIVVDPYNFIAQRRKSGDTETEFVSEMLSKFKSFLIAYSLHGWMIAHPTKSGPDKDPNQLVGLYSISGGANWANKADIGITVHRTVNEDMTRSNETIVAVTKVRQAWIGQPGQAKLWYNYAKGRYVE